jgi:hypothetical protein
MLALGAVFAAALQFAWPAPAEAQVELTDERRIGDERRTIVMTMRLRVEPDVFTDRVAVRMYDARIQSIDGAIPGDADAAHTLLAVSRVMKNLTPAMLVGPDGRFVGTRELDRLSRDVLTAVGLPALPVGAGTFASFLSDMAAEDWGTWVGAWLGESLAPGESREDERELDLAGARVPVRTAYRGLTPAAPAGHTRLEASAVYPAEAVRQYTQGFLIDLATEARELRPNDPVASLRFLDRAQYSPMTTTLTVELETATMRPLFAERMRTFSAEKGKLKVAGCERRTHRVTWLKQGEPTSVE